MPALADRLRELDRRVLRMDRAVTVEQWTKAMSHWKLLVVLAVAEGLALLAVVLAGDNAARYPLLALIPQSLMFAFYAGQMKVEHDRITGRGSGLTKRRPPGV